MRHNTVASDMRREAERCALFLYDEAGLRAVRRRSGFVLFCVGHRARLRATSLFGLVVWPARWLV